MGLACRDDPVAIGQIEGHGLLAEDSASTIAHCRFDDSRMSTRVSRDTHDIGALFTQHFVVIGIQCLDTETPTKFF